MQKQKIKTEIFSLSSILDLEKLDFESSILFFDQNLLKIPRFKKVISKAPYILPLKAGESLKNLQNFSRVFSEALLLREKMPSQKVRFVAIGGGSIGDFVGFLASTFKRGVPLIHVPTTALAAIDSAHGGKTALNFKIGQRVFKNQIGTFYPAQEVWLVEEFFKNLPESTLIDGYGEAIKISLIEGGKLWKDFIQEDDWNSKVLMKYLPRFIAAKMKIVHQDPFEKTGVRQVLNLGHTVGHVLESDLKLSHGMSVLLGLAFAQEWGLQKGLTRRRFVDLPDHRLALKKLKNTEALLKQDKKRSSQNGVHFIFFKEPGKLRILRVPIEEIIHEIHRQIQELEPRG